MSLPRIRRPGPTVRVRVVEHSATGVRRREDRVAAEEPLEVRVRWPGEVSRPVLVTMRTPGNDFELAVGVLHAEGVLLPEQLRSVAYCDDAAVEERHAFNVVTVTLDSPPPRAVEGLTRSGSVTAASSACGVCGADSIDAVLDERRHRPSVAAPADGTSVPLEVPIRVPTEVVHALPDRLRAQQRLFDTTGGVHAAGFFDTDGTPTVVREDIGRHNAVDKAVGHLVLAGAPTAAPVLAVSGRLGYEIVQKAVVAGVPVVVAVGAPSSLAVELAAAAGTTLVGFTSPHRFVVHTHPERIGV